MLDEQQKAAKQAALNKALSTALLTHQISELESRVQSLNTTTIPGLPQQPRKEAAKTGAEHDVNARQNRVARIDDPDEGSQGEPSDDDEDDKEAWRAVVVDVSALMWALKSVRRLVAKGWEVIVPLDGIRTLDLLKKGSSASAVASRSAARYVEHASRQWKILSADPSLTVQSGTNYKKGVGLRIQRDAELSDISELSSLPIPIDGVEPWAQSVLSCVAFFATIDAAEVAAGNDEGQRSDEEDRNGDLNELQRPILYVANPPLAVEAAELDIEDSKYVERGEGYALSQEAERFEVILEVLRDHESEDGFAEGRGRGRRGRGRGRSEGRGRGRGMTHGHGHEHGHEHHDRHDRSERGPREDGKRGRGHGRHERHGERRRGHQQEDEPAKEYKILRRPASDDTPFPAPGVSVPAKTLSASQGSPLTASPKLPILEQDQPTSPTNKSKDEHQPPAGLYTRTSKHESDSSDTESSSSGGGFRGGRGRGGGRRGRGGRGRGRDRRDRDGRRSPQFELLQRPDRPIRPPPPVPPFVGEPPSPPPPRLLTRSGRPEPPPFSPRGRPPGPPPPPFPPPPYVADFWSDGPPGVPPFSPRGGRGHGFRPPRPPGPFGMPPPPPPGPDFDSFWSTWGPEAGNRGRGRGGFGGRGGWGHGMWEQPWTPRKPYGHLDDPVEESKPAKEKKVVVLQRPK